MGVRNGGKRKRTERNKVDERGTRVSICKRPCFRPAFIQGPRWVEGVQLASLMSVDLSGLAAAASQVRIPEEPL